MPTRATNRGCATVRVHIVASAGFEEAGLSILAARWRDALAISGVPSSLALPRSRQRHPDEGDARGFTCVIDEIRAWRRTSDSTDRLLVVGMPATDAAPIVAEAARDSDRTIILWERPGVPILEISDSLPDVSSNLRVATLNASLAQQLRRQLPDVRVSVIPPALPAEAFLARGPSWPFNYAIAVGRLTSRKGADQLACRWAEEVGPRLRLPLIMLGAGHGGADSVEKKVLDVASRTPWISVTAMPNFNDRFRLMRRAHCAVFAARDEHLPQALLECMAAATVPIVTPIAGHLDAVADRVNGLVLSNLPLGDLGDRVEEALSKDLRCALGAAAANRALSYTPLRVAAHIRAALH